MNLSEGFHLEWRNLRYSIGKGRPLVILDDVSGEGFPNRLLGVLGGSGAGKTTLLNAIGSRLLTDQKHVLTGEISINGINVKGASENLAFVTQQDIVFDTATPEESLYFSARVRAGLGKEDAMRRTKEVLKELMLMDVKDTVLGTPGLNRGVSGGERKRTNIGVELITNPKILLLDEPTSGLDSFTAEKVVQTLHDLAHRGRTIICTIHQPSADVYNLLDDLMLLVEGKVVYLGTRERCIDYFSSIGYECPNNFTPTDYFMTLMQDEDVKYELIQEWSKLVASGEVSQFQYDPKKSSTSKENEFSPNHDSNAIKCTPCNEAHQASFVVQCQELFVRSFRNYSRNKYFLIAQLGQSFVVAFIVGAVFINLGMDQTSVQDRMGLFFMISTNTAFASAGSVINTFAVEKSVFIREQQSRAYSPLCYFLGKTLGETPFHLVFSFIAISVIYLMTGLTRQFSTYLSILGTSTLGYQSGVSLGLLLGAVCPNFLVSSALLPLILVPMLLAGGLAVSTSRLSGYWIWLKKISVVRYAFTALARFEFSNINHISCDESKFPGQCAFMYQNGMDVLKRFGMDSRDNETWVLLASLAGILVLMRICAVVALYRVAKFKS